MGGGNAREVALLSLAACEGQGAWSDGYLKRAVSRAGLDRRDAALAARLCYGVLQNRMLCDFWIDRFSSVKAARLEVQVACALRLALYQLAFLDKIPASAAVNESVSLARKYARNPRAAGLVNGVLRAFLRAEERPMPRDLATRYSHPAWLVEELRRALRDQGVEELLAADNGQPPTTVQVNPLKASPEETLERLRDAGVKAEAHPWLPGCLLLSGTGNLEELAPFQEGWLTVQDAAARLAVLAAEVSPGMEVLDCCAAPGGKSFAAAMDLKNRGRVVSCDIHPHKLKLIQKGAERLGVSIVEACQADGKVFQPRWEGKFQRVIADVPCSGLGIIRKKPDIRYKDPKPLEGLPQVQGAILDNVSRYVAPGGVLLYSTCTLLERENGGVVDGFLARHPQFRPEAFTLPGPAGRVESGRLTLWPHVHGTDGFYIARLRRKEADL